MSCACGICGCGNINCNNSSCGSEKKDCFESPHKKKECCECVPARKPCEATACTAPCCACASLCGNSIDMLNIHCERVIAAFINVGALQTSKNCTDRKGCGSCADNYAVCGQKLVIKQHGIYLLHFDLDISWLLKSQGIKFVLEVMSQTESDGYRSVGQLPPHGKVYTSGAHQRNEISVCDNNKIKGVVKFENVYGCDPEATLSFALVLKHLDGHHDQHAPCFLAAYKFTVHGKIIVQPLCAAKCD